jgi:hypothetical protein
MRHSSGPYKVLTKSCYESGMFRKRKTFAKQECLSDVKHSVICSRNSEIIEAPLNKQPCTIEAILCFLQQCRLLSLDFLA